MKQGKTLTELAVEIERQKDSKHDYIAESRAFTLQDNGRTMEIEGVGPFGLTQHARQQLATKLDIPLAYFDRLQDKHPALLAQNVNELARREPQRNMVRTLDGNIRGFLSDRFRPLDNFDLADAVLPIITEYKGEGLEVASCEITETRMYIKVLLPWLDRELPVPEGLKMGVGHNWFIRKIIGSMVISNSEVGAGALNIIPACLRSNVPTSPCSAKKALDVCTSARRLSMVARKCPSTFPMTRSGLMTLSYGQRCVMWCAPRWTAG